MKIFLQIFTIALCACISFSAAAQAEESAACDSGVRDLIYQNAEAQAQHDQETAAVLILKPDSVLEYSCFTDGLADVVRGSALMLSANSNTGLRPIFNRKPWVFGRIPFPQIPGQNPHGRGRNPRGGPQSPGLAMDEFQPGFPGHNFPTSLPGQVSTVQNPSIKSDPGPVPDMEPQIPEDPDSGSVRRTDKSVRPGAFIDTEQYGIPENFPDFDDIPQGITEFSNPADVDTYNLDGSIKNKRDNPVKWPGVLHMQTTLTNVVVDSLDSYFAANFSNTCMQMEKVWHTQKCKNMTNFYFGDIFGGQEARGGVQSLENECGSNIGGLKKAGAGASGGPDVVKTYIYQITHAENVSKPQACQESAIVETGIDVRDPVSPEYSFDVICSLPGCVYDAEKGECTDRI